MEEKELLELEGLLRAATPAPWWVSRASTPDFSWVEGNAPMRGHPEVKVRNVAGFDAPEDAAAIASLRTAADSLISDLRSARAWIAEARKVLGEHGTAIVDKVAGVASGNAAQPPPDSVSESVGLREARRLLGEARELLYNFGPVTTGELREQIRAFLGEKNGKG